MTMNPGARPAARTEHEMYLGTFFLVITWGKQSDRPPARYTPFEPGYFHLGQGDVTPPLSIKLKAKPQAASHKGK
jgi:hypothetical protein